jgi:hypothetical protein
MLPLRGACLGLPLVAEFLHPATDYADLKEKPLALPPEAVDAVRKMTLMLVDSPESKVLFAVNSK